MDPKPSPPRPPAADAPRRRQRPKRKAREEDASGAASPPPPPKRRARARNASDRPGRVAPKPRRKPACNEATLRCVVEPQEKREAPPPRPSLEEEVEAVLSRGPGVHVVPTFAGWFSWNKIHPIEKQRLATFFDGKSEKRTPEIYMGIRNFIMTKFHFNPQVHLEFKDLSELSIGGMDAGLEVLKFLAYWGLVNFHPFPPDGQECKLLESKSNADTEEKRSVIEKLFQFETVQSYLVPVSNKADIASPDQAAHLLSEPILPEDLVNSAESSVEYHCNSCSVDCSRKRYHCRTQADFDLCSDCYSEGKFDEGMSQLDFILMNSAEVPGSGGAIWTDQDTLLLLEALEIFKGNGWDDIAEHVATKNKAQCMLYFLQMPILDSFLDDDFFNQTSQKISVKDSTENVTEVPEKMENSMKANASSETGINLAGKNVSVKKDTEDSGANDLVTASIVDEMYKTSVSDPANKKKFSDVNVSGEHASSLVSDVLRSAFEAAEHFPKKEGACSFTEAGNPVMALAAFLSGLVEHDDSVTSCRSSLRAILDISPALLLATQHCFILPDPPNELGISPLSVSPVSYGGMDQKNDDATPNASDSDKVRKAQGAMIMENQSAAFTSHNEPQELSSLKGSSAPPNDTDRNEPCCISSQEASASTEDPKEHNGNENTAADDDSFIRLQRAACTSISAAAVKAKLLADREEYLIWQLADVVIQKQLQKMEAKMSLMAEVEHMASRGQELVSKIRKRLLTEQSAIFFPLRVAAMQSRLNQRGAPGTRVPIGYGLNQHVTRP